VKKNKWEVESENWSGTMGLWSNVTNKTHCFLGIVVIKKLKMDKKTK